MQIGSTTSGDEGQGSGMAQEATAVKATLPDGSQVLYQITTDPDTSAPTCYAYDARNDAWLELAQTPCAVLLAIAEDMADRLYTYQTPTPHTL